MASYNLAPTYCTHFISSYTEAHASPGIGLFLPWHLCLGYSSLPGMFFHLCLSKSYLSFHTQFQCHLLSEDFPGCPWRLTTKVSLEHTEIFIYTPPLITPHSPHINFAISQGPDQSFISFFPSVLISTLNCCWEESKIKVFHPSEKYLGSHLGRKCWCGKVVRSQGVNEEAEMSQVWLPLAKGSLSSISRFLLFLLPCVLWHTHTYTRLSHLKALSICTRSAHFFQSLLNYCLSQKCRDSFFNDEICLLIMDSFLFDKSLINLRIPIPSSEL